MRSTEKLYEGKAKIVYSTESQDKVVIYYKDDATAFNGEKKERIQNKGVLNNKITSLIYDYLNKEGIPTHYIQILDDRSQLCKKISIIPLEIITRNVIAGSMSKRLGVPEGTDIDKPVFELSYKNDDLGDPLINDDHAIALKLCTTSELEEIKLLTAKINIVLIEMFKSIDIKLVDFKLEFGKDINGNIVLADEISPDTCRLWDINSNEKLDKDRFRRDLGNVEDAYSTVLNKVLTLGKKRAK